MSRRVFTDGVLLQEWDDATRTYRRWSTAGVLLEERAYTAGEIAAIVGAGAATLGDRDFIVIDDDGTEILRIGDQQFGDRGITISREDGTLALSIRKRLAGAGTQSLELRDDNGNVILSESEFGTGLDYPWLPLVVQPWSATSAAVQTGPHGLEGPAVTSGTFVTTHMVELPRMNQQTRWRFAIKASDATTAGEVQVIRESTGVALTKFLQPAWVGTRAAGSTGYVDVDPGAPLVLPGSYITMMRLLVQVRRTAGAGSLTCAVPFAHGYAPAY